MSDRIVSGIIPIYDGKIGKNVRKFLCFDFFFYSTNDSPAAAAVEEIKRKKEVVMQLNLPLSWICSVQCHSGNDRRTQTTDRRAVRNVHTYNNVT